MAADLKLKLIFYFMKKTHKLRQMKLDIVKCHGHTY